MNKKVTKSSIISFIESLPENYIIPLKSDSSIQLKPDQIIENIENKTKIGKLYYIQIGKFLSNNKKENEKSQNLIIL